MANKPLSVDFILELIKLSLTNTKVLEICEKHLKFQYLVTESQKKVLQFIYNTYNLSKKVPTFGLLQQTFSVDQDAITLLTKVKKIVVDNDQVDEILETLEQYIKDSRFRILYDKLGDLYNEGKTEQVYSLLSKESQEIIEFSIKDTYYTTVFSGFKERQENRERNKDTILLEKLTFGVHEMDDVTKGGFNKGTSALVLARSGGGKSTFLRWVGLCNARLGRRVVHFQGEGTEQECLDAYDAGWTSISMHDIEYGNIPQQKKAKIYKAQRDILANKGEIFVYAAESFDTMSVDGCRTILQDIIAQYGPVDLVIFDYLEIFTVKGQYGSSESSERKRRDEIANKMTNIAIEFKCGVISATQANDVSKELYNKPDWVMTRSQISEHKGSIRPFSYFMTLNSTDDEYAEEILRIHFDKLRKYKKPSEAVKIYQSRNNSRFYDSKKTLTELYKTNK